MYFCRAICITLNILLDLIPVAPALCDYSLVYLLTRSVAGYNIEDGTSLKKKQQQMYSEMLVYLSFTKMLLFSELKETLLTLIHTGTLYRLAFGSSGLGYEERGKLAFFGLFLPLYFLNVMLKCAVTEAHAVKCPWLAGCGERMVFQSCSFVLLLVFKDTT